ncbi:YkvA family protein [Inconstantimicrobium mannanitabidum]|uniref:Uncharacterized protein n=1 Tax=Inconstantimicrobium mannanitabidum TaxID=1604901 RepID=A0ACB5R9U0_9CLOT|nr:YkvA family protein [Clostridium sp. TW13]GKX65892.1 hypothetical protein rsdtw13_11500 [Clostridium sp. TW13]
MDIKEFKQKMKKIKKDVYVLYNAYRHPKTPWYVKILAILVIAYAVSPIDLIPDFIPILGYLDDLLIIPAGITLVIKLIPPEVIEECREQQEDKAGMRKKGIIAAVFILLLWGWIIYKIVRIFV